jgi:hypothetical protein
MSPAWHEFLQAFGQFGRIFGEALRVGIKPVPAGVQDTGRHRVLRRGADRQTSLPIIDGAKKSPRRQRPQGADRLAMREIHMVSRLQETPPVGNAGGIPAHAVAEQRAHIGFVEGGKMPNPVAIAARHQGGIIGEPKSDIAILPAAKIIQRLRQIPMIQAQPGLYAVAEQFVDQTIIEVEAQAVGLAAPFGNTRGQATENR